MLYDVVMRMQREVGAALNRCQLDFARISRSHKEIVSFCSQLSESISPLLLDHGFLRRKNCFFRIHGDGLIQMIGVQHASRTVFGVYTYVYPLYEITKCILDLGNDIHHMIGLTSRDSDFVIYARSIEAVANINNGDPFVQCQLNMDLPIKAERMLLEDRIIPILNTCRTGSDAIEFNHDPRWKKYESICWQRNNWYSFSFLLRDRVYSDCALLMDQMIDHYQTTIEELQNPEMTEGMQHRLKLSDEEVMQWKVSIKSSAEPLIRKLLSISKLKNSIMDGNEHHINQTMNDATISIYQYLKTLNRKITDLYPVEKYLL